MKTHRPHISIIIVSFNTARLLSRCLDSIKDCFLASQGPNSVQIEVVVVDNNSTDDSCQQVSARIEHFPCQLQLIQNQHNVGFGRANNQGAQVATGEVLWFLNSDAFLTDQKLFSNVSALIPLLGCQPSTDQVWGGIATSLCNEDMSNQPQGGDEPSLFSLAAHFLFLDDIPYLGKFLPSTQHTGRRSSKNGSTSAIHVVEYGWIAATSMLVHRAVFHKIGGFDPDIFLYGEDVELSWRLRLQGYKVGVWTRGGVVHSQSASSDSSTAIKGEILAYIYIWKKHFPAWQLVVVRLVLTVGACLRTILFGTMGRKQRSAAYWQALPLIWTT